MRLGKTVTFADIVRRVFPRKTLVIAHRAELIHQAKDKIERVTGYHVEVEMADQRANMGAGLFSSVQVVVSTIQTQTAGGDGGGRMGKFDPAMFGLLIIDECFPAGTLIDGKPIERYAKGDSVCAFNHATGTPIASRVTHTFKSIPQALVSIRFQDGRRITCTPGHPFYRPDLGRYSPATELTPGGLVLTRQQRTSDVSQNLHRLPNSIFSQLQPCYLLEDLRTETQTANEVSARENTVCCMSHTSHLRTGTATAGYKERFTVGIARVERVEILEPGSDGKFGGLCPDGFVYNLEVENHHNYFVEDILVHNCHHATAASYRRVIDYYRQNPNLKVLGVTATPDRADEEALGQVFQTVAYDYEILDAIRDGWLVPVDQQVVEIEGLDFSTIRTTAGDLNGADLAAVMEAEKPLHGIADATVKIAGDRRTLVFAASVHQAEMLSDIFNRHRPGRSGWVCGKTDKDERARTLADFAAGRLQFVVNVGVLTEGFDDPGVELIVMGRPTKSRSLYAQMCGRALRPLPGVVDDADDSPEHRRAAIAASPKPSCLIVDIAGNAGRHKLVSTAEILGGKVTEEAVQIAVDKARKAGKPVRMDELLDEAEQERIEKEEEAKRLEAARRARLVAKSRYTVESVNPFDMFHIRPARERGWERGKEISPKMRGLIEKHYPDVNIDQITFTQARQLSTELFRRWDNKLASYKQVKLLAKHGIDAANMSMADAGAAIDALAKNGWRRVA